MEHGILARWGKNGRMLGCSGCVDETWDGWLDVERESLRGRWKW